ncbi:MAG: hypothetical protein K8S23_00340 [Candidatus Cloacimonetes bacterium]|nr:hypothetical protein [Candidatus Cloacimonadota bacterium]
MNKFKILLKKDWIINKKSLLIPFWVTAGFYLLMLISLAIAYFHKDATISGFSEFPPFPSGVINYIGNMGIVALPGVISLLITILIMQSALNEDMRKNYELFHRSQPVSLWARVGSKFMMGTAANWAVLFIISIFNFIVLNSVLIYHKQFVFGAAFTGMLQPLVVIMKTGLVLGSMTFFASAIFKDKAFFKGTVVLVSLQFMFLILNAIFNWHIPTPLGLLTNLMETKNLAISGSEISEIDLNYLLKDRWNEILFNMKTVYQILLSAVFFVAATFIYDNREVKID